VLNPSVNAACTNLWLGYSYCVVPVGSMASYPGYTGTEVLPQTGPAFTPQPGKPVPWNMPNRYEPSSRYPTIPIANGTRGDCWTYVTSDHPLAAQ
jgi:hypothetical protein